MDFKKYIRLFFISFFRENDFGGGEGRFCEIIDAMRLLCTFSTKNNNSYISISSGQKLDLFSNDDGLFRFLWIRLNFKLTFPVALMVLLNVFHYDGTIVLMLITHLSVIVNFRKWRAGHTVLRTLGKLAFQLKNNIERPLYLVQWVYTTFTILIRPEYQFWILGIEHLKL